MGEALKAMAGAMARPSDLNIVDWACKYVKIPKSARSPKFDIDSTPWLRWPMEQIATNDNKEVVLMAPVGSGKTTMLEGTTQWIVAEEPGDMLIIFQTDPDARDWVDTRFHPSIKLNEKVAPLIPTGKNKGNFRKNEILFSHMALFTGGANLSNLQSKSMRWVYGDEVWLWRDGMLEEARRRTHDRWNSRVVLVSQGGVEGDQLDGAFKEADIHDLCFKCPECSEVQRYEWGQMKYDKIKTEAGENDWTAIGDTVHYHCKACDHGFKDTPNERRRLSMTGDYVSRGNNHMPDKVAGTYPAMAVWWIEWRKLVREWINANEQRKKMNLVPLRQFIQKRLAQSWVEPVETVNLKGATEAYRKKDYFDGQKWDEENFRFMTVDVQQDHFWVVIRAWSLESKSRLLYEGRVDEWEGLRMLQRRMNVPNRCVFVDRGYKPDTVATECRRAITTLDKSPWNCLLGRESDGYPFKVRGKTLTRAYSSVKGARTNTGIMYKYVMYSNLLAKDTLSSLMRGDGESWQVPVDHSAEYLKQMENERKVEKAPGKWRYEPSKSWVGNHLWDCETMQVIAASIFGVFKRSIDSLDEE